MFRGGMLGKLRNFKICWFIEIIMLQLFKLNKQKFATLCRSVDAVALFVLYS